VRAWEKCQKVTQTKGEYLDTVIHIDGVYKSFAQPRSLSEIMLHPFSRRRIHVLRGVNLRIQQGVLLGLLGYNGAGKTTLLRLLSATVSPDKGVVKVLGEDATKRPELVHKNLGVVLDDERSFYWRLTARQNLRFFASMYNLTNREAKKRIEVLADLLDLGSELDKSFRNLSTGWRHRLALARAMLHDPKVLILDEPTRGMDPKAAMRVRSLVASRLVAEQGKTVVMATHDLETIEHWCHRLALLDNGRISIEGPVEECIDEVRSMFGLHHDPLAEDSVDGE